MQLTLNSVPAPHGGQPVFTAGVPLDQAARAMILIHGRGAGAADILTLAAALARPTLAYIAPQAANATWYPNSFLAPLASNEPGIASGLGVIAALIAEIEATGIAAKNILLGGFSQGACLASEFAARNPRRYGGLLIFSGGLIGPPSTPRDYPGTLDGTPVFLGCSDVDFHIPQQRVDETGDVLAAMGADVTKVIYPGMGHTIVDDEIVRARQVIDGRIGD